MVTEFKSVYSMHKRFINVQLAANTSYLLFTVIKPWCCFCLLLSGGHLNPAVSVCVYLVGGMELVLLGPYILAQMFGGMIGAGIAKVRLIINALYCDMKVLY